MLRVGFVCSTLSGTPIFVRQSDSGLWEDDNGWFYTGELVCTVFTFQNLPIIFFHDVEWMRLMYSKPASVESAIGAILLSARYGNPIDQKLLANLRILRQEYMYKQWLSDCRYRFMREE